MKKSDFFTVFILALIISFSFLSIKTQTNKAYGQTASSSSSSGSTTSSSSSSSGSTTSSSSSSGSSTSSSSGSTTSSSSSSSGSTTSSSSSSSGSSTSSSSSGSSTSSSSSGSSSVSLNQNFTGVWKAEISRPKPSSSSSSGSTRQGEDHSPRGSRIITFKLCIKDGSLVGSTVQQGGVLNMGVITSQTIISSDEVSVNVEGDKGAKATIDLKLTNEREFVGTFADSRTFKARKLNPFRACLAPTQGEGQGHEGMSGPFMGDHGMGHGPETSSSGSEDDNGDGPHGPAMGGFMGGPGMSSSTSSSGGIAG